MFTIASAINKCEKLVPEMYQERKPTVTAAIVRQGWRRADVPACARPWRAWIADLIYEYLCTYTSSKSFQNERLTSQCIRTAVQSVHMWFRSRTLGQYLHNSGLPLRWPGLLGVHQGPDQSLRTLAAKRWQIKRKAGRETCVDVHSSTGRVVAKVCYLLQRCRHGRGGHESDSHNNIED